MSQRFYTCPLQWTYLTRIGIRNGLATGKAPYPHDHRIGVTHMNKSLIALAALAVLASTGAAFAQSTVTIYGRIDNSIGAQKDLGKST